MKTIHISTELEQKIVAFCDDELNYHINDSGFAGEYASEIEAQIELLRLLGHEDMAKSYEEQFREEIGEQEEHGGQDENSFGIYAATCAPEFNIGRKIETGEDEYYLIKAADAVEAKQLFKEKMHRMYKSFQYDFHDDNIREQYKAAVQNGDICDYFAETDGVVDITESELESIEDISPSDYDDKDKEEDWEETRKENIQLLLDFIEENLEDFVGFDPYADTSGYDLRRAWDEKETYVYSLSDDSIATLADEIRERREDFYCEEGDIVDRRTREAEKE